ncbi:MAG: hypothetical protein MUC87_21560 [Bacteroidia bacterium]|nr:hypothetical protein [Bacteroidia bacterium]
MKRVLSFLTLAFCFKLSFSQNYTDSLGLKQGLWIINYTNDTVLHELNCLRLCTYKNDTLNGEMLIYNGKGKLRYQATYINGKPRGTECFYAKNGKLLRTQSHHNDSAYSVTDYYGRSKPYRIANYTNNKLNGAYTYFWRSGKIKQINYYKNEIEVSETIYFRRNGRVRYKS